ncbi:MAG: YifB family Mg chelatase-like AAA ATPase [Thiogranum sp.]|nr:YifB family Mg chelatase-like AAA ATPase [Thiogranum sp.]
MALAILYSRAQLGVQAPLVTVEVHLANGLPALSIVGLPETAVKESRERVRSALMHSGFEFPARRITVNLAPADLPKQGGRYDLAIALGILAASDQLPKDRLDDYEFVAELALSGATRRVPGILPAALSSRASARTLICATANGEEAALVDATAAHTADHLLEVCEHLRGLQPLPQAQAVAARESPITAPDLREVRGQHHARRALEIAAAGSHSLLLVGPPGTGKTLLASRLPGLLPGLSTGEALETAAIMSVSQGGFDARHWRRRPFRAPHHSASAAALVGGGSHPRPGEISLAHQGVLFLDELPEFSRHVLEVLREPLESGSITISRAANHAEFPARFQLVAAMNPCPCGYLGDADSRCNCSADQIHRYHSRISGPLLDRIDLQIEMQRLSWEQLQAGAAEDSATVRHRVVAARSIQQSRGHLNAHLPLPQMEISCILGTQEKQALQQAMNRFRLSPRSVHRILKVARTIADLDASDAISLPHLSEAINYRCLDKRQPQS